MPPTQEMLYGRERELSQLEFALFDQPIEPDIYFIHGQSGVGKTNLCNYFRNVILRSDQSNHCDLHLDVTRDTTEQDVIRLYYNVLKNNYNGIFSFPRYEIACTYLYRLTNNSQYNIDEPLDSVNKIVDILVEASQTLLDEFKLCPLAKLSVKPIATLFIKKGIDWANEQIIKRRESKYRDFINKLNFFSLDTIASNLTQYWIDDVNETLSDINDSHNTIDFHHHLIFTLDSFEQRPKYEYEEDWFVSKLIPHIYYSKWFIFSTESKFILQTFDIKLKPFSDDILREYLKLLKVDDSNAQDFILKQSEGLPAAIKILLDIYFENNNSFPDAAMNKGYRALFSFYYNKHLSAEDRKVINYLLFFPVWDYTVFKYFVSVDSETRFAALTQNTALIEKIDDKSFRFIGIVEKTLHSILDNKQSNEEVTSAHKGRFLYYSDKTNQIIDILRNNSETQISYALYSELSSYMRMAFSAASLAYSDGAEFNEYSSWCLKAEQFLSVIGLFNLKASLIETFMKDVTKRDGFQYDEIMSENKRFRFRLTRDLAWAYHMLRNAKQAVSISGNYYLELLITYGVRYPRIPFALYLIGLSFRDSGDYETAKWFLEQSIQRSEALGTTIQNIDSSIPSSITARNILGHMETDLGHYEKAEQYLLLSQEARPEDNIKGKWVSYSNLSRLYFRWMQSLAVNNDRDSCSRYLDKAETCLHEAEEIQNISPNLFSVMERYSVATRRYLLSIARDLLDLNDVSIVPQGHWDWYIQKLRELRKHLTDLRQHDLQSLMWCIDNDIAVLHVYQGNYSLAKAEFSDCLATKERFYSNVHNGGIVAQFRPTIEDTRHNLNAIEDYVRYPSISLMQYQFIIQY